MQEEEKQGSVEQARRALQEDAQKRAQAAAAAFNEALARICQQYRVQVRYGTGMGGWRARIQGAVFRRIAE